ncbi:MAG: hypothetical protein N4A45_07720 [Flavobacteriales bacterium]|jgi:hypothetical protein|nr:hypothetical protein [Flavobacteriales bacterium]
MKQYAISPFEGGRGMLHNANTPKKKLKKKSNSIMKQYAISPFEGGRGMLHNANTPKKKLKKKM